MSRQEAIVDRLRAWMCTVALPFWASAGVDAATGAFHERLLSDGAPDLSASRRLRVQARQIYVYAHAHVLGWAPDGARIALRAFDHLQATWPHRPGGSFVQTLDADGGVALDVCDTYDHAFLVLAFAWLARASGQARVRMALDDVLQFADTHLAAPDGSLREGWPASLPRRQNPHMHWFEAMLALKDALDHPEAAPRAAGMLRLFHDHFYDPATATIGEYFTDDWLPAPGADGESVEPGHLAEWVWLIRRHAALFGAEPGDIPSRLLASASASADPITGLLVDETDRRGQVRKATRRSWLQTELAKAWIAEAEIGRQGAREMAVAALEALWAHHLGKPFPAGWVDQLGADARPLEGPVPSSILYHVFVAVAEADRVLG